MKTELMKNSNQKRLTRRTAFTLVELLVVIAIMAILAALIFPAVKGVKAKSMRSKAEAELKQIEAAIDSYKAKYGHYPPDNPGTPALNQLFYELQGTTQTNLGGVAVFQTLDGRTNIPVASVSALFGPGVGGFVNCTKAGGGDDFAAAKKFVSGLTPGQYGFLASGIGLLTSSVPWPKNLGPVILGWPDELNPIRYNSSSPTGNPKSYDLWVDIVISGKTNRISNWSAQPEIVN
jgi:prepilin-type N-terminal cleavage/methylation domain-containing protein